MKLRRSLALMLTLAALGGTMTIAQEPKTPKKPEAKPAAKDDKKPAAAGKVEVYEAKKGWRYRIKDTDDKVIAMPSKSWEKKEEVYKVLDDIKNTLNTVKPVEVKE